MTMTKFKIEKNIPIPNTIGEHYPFAKMKVKDSFVVGRLDAKQAPRFRTAALNQGRKLKMKFSVKKVADGALRCWRIK